MDFPDLIKAALLIFVGFFADRALKKAQVEKTKQETKTSEFTRMTDMLKEYQERYAEQQAEAKELKQELRDLRNEVRVLRAEFQALDEQSRTERLAHLAQIDCLTNENRSLQTQLARYETANADLRKQVETLVNRRRASDALPLQS